MAAIVRKLLDRGESKLYLRGTGGIRGDHRERDQHGGGHGGDGTGHRGNTCCVSTDARVRLRYTHHAPYLATQL